MQELDFYDLNEVVGANAPPDDGGAAYTFGYGLNGAAYIDSTGG